MEALIVADETPTPPNPPTPANPTGEAPDLAAVRLEKLRPIEALGIDPWGQRFDNAQPIGDVVKLPADLPEGQRPRVRIAGRIVGRRPGGSLHFLDVKDCSGEPTTRQLKGKRKGEEEQVPDLTS